MCGWAAVVPALQATGYDGRRSFESLWRVPVRHRGYVAQDLVDAFLPPRDIDQRPGAELAYLRALVGSRLRTRC